MPIKQDSSRKDKDKKPATRELLATTQWPGGKVSFRCTGVDCDDVQAQGVIDELDRLASGWHIMFIWFVGVLNSRGIMQRQMVESIGPKQSVSVGSIYANGETGTFHTKVNREEALGSLSDEYFGQYHAKALVLSAFSLWEDTVRPNIQRLLGVPLNTAKSDLMHELRLLRNWLTHPSIGGTAEKEYFEGAENLHELLESQPGRAEITVNGAFLLIAKLNNLSITVNPLGQEEIAKFVQLSPETLKRIESQLGPNDKIVSW